MLKAAFFFDWNLLWGTLCADGRKVYIECVINNTLSEKFMGHSGRYGARNTVLKKFKNCIRLAKLTIQ